MRITATAIDPDALRQELTDHGAGGYVAFEGWIRNQNEGQAVLRLEYEVYAPLAIKEGERIIDEASARFPILKAECVHREGLLELGECAVWVGVCSTHRDEAFAACRFIIDEVKVRLPIWKKEFYRNGDSGWVNCERCAAHAPPSRELLRNQ
jgi:molybdopterin synthase catalytic subunit